MIIISYFNDCNHKTENDTNINLLKIVKCV